MKDFDQVKHRLLIQDRFKSTTAIVGGGGGADIMRSVDRLSVMIGDLASEGKKTNENLNKFLSAMIPKFGPGPIPEVAPVVVEVGLGLGEGAPPPPPPAPAKIPGIVKAALALQQLVSPTESNPRRRVRAVGHSDNCLCVEAVDE
jgi:hypothetical protein